MAEQDEKPRVLLVEDENSMREVLRINLSAAGFAVSECADGCVAAERLSEEQFDLILLDVMLPGLDGVSICKTLRAGGPNHSSPVLMLTARAGESDKVAGLESGADDYLVKPFGVRELMARVGALSRRFGCGPVNDADLRPSPACPIQMDVERRTATLRGQPLELTKQEFDLLFRLVTHRGIVFSRDALLQSVWRDDWYVNGRTIDTVISRLRRKIEKNPQDPEWILTAWGVGYKFADAE